MLNPEALGFRAPRIFYAPPGIVSFEKAKAAIKLAGEFGIALDDWQELALLLYLAERADGKWAAFETGGCVPRQNGKGGIIEPLELAGIYLFGERLIIHSAHEFSTASEAMIRLEEILEGRGEKFRPTRAHGAEGFTFPTGQRIRYRTRTAGGGRGTTGDRVIMDEAMILKDAAVGALLPTMSAKSITGNPQVNYFGSAVDQALHEHGMAFARVRARARRGMDPSLAYLEWAAEVEPAEEGGDPTPDDVDGAVAADPVAWRQANPALGIRIAEEHVAREQRSMDRRSFAVERLGIGDWPDVDEDVASVIDRVKWAALEDVASTMQTVGWFGFDVSPSRAYASVTVAGWRPDGLAHLEVVQTGRGTSWLEDYLVSLLEHRPAGFVCDGQSAAASLIPALRKRRVRVEVMETAGMAAACGMLYDRVEKKGLRHRDSPELAAALKVATKRKLMDRWAWSRQGSRGDITPLVAGTASLWALETRGRRRRAPAVVVR